MKKIILIRSCFWCLQSYSQLYKRDTIYLFIDKNDSLIRKQKGTGGYDICFDEKKRMKKNKTPVIEGKVWVADTKYDYYECLYFGIYKTKKQFLNLV